MSLVTENKSYATEGSRWYTTQGTSVEDVIGRNGNARKPTLRDARKEGWIPSVTSILQIMAKPELEGWKMREVAKRCGYSMIGEEENEDEYAARMVEKAKEEMSKARDTGSDVHGEIDRFLLSDTLVQDRSPHVIAASSALAEIGIYGLPMKVETPFCAGGIAGKVDLMSVADSLKDSWIVDWKTTSKPLDDGKCPDYDEYCAQLAAYSVGNFGELVPCYNVFLSTSIPGNYMVRKWGKDELDRGWHIYSTCRTLWMLKNNYKFL